MAICNFQTARTDYSTTSVLDHPWIRNLNRESNDIMNTRVGPPGATDLWTDGDNHIRVGPPASTDMWKDGDGRMPQTTLRFGVIRNIFFLFYFCPFV